MQDTVFNYDVIIIIAVVVNAVFNFVAVNIFLTFIWTPAIADIGGYVYYFKRRKETVFNAFFKAVSINRFTKIAEVRNIFCFFWGCRHAYLRCTAEIF